MEIPELEYLHIDDLKLSEIRELHYFNSHQIIELNNGMMYLFRRDLTYLPRVDYNKESNFLTVHW